MANSPLAKRANGKWYDILKQIGVDPIILNGRHQPCPGCGGTDRFRWDNKEGRGTYYCSNCGAGDGFELLRLVYNCDFAEAARMVEDVIGKATKDAPRKEVDYTKRLIGMARTLVKVTTGSAVAKYLESRHLPVPSSNAIKMHRSLRYYDDGQLIGEFPAMVGLVTNSHGKKVSLHVTYLNKDGSGKADVRSPKKLVAPTGSPDARIELYPVNGVVLGVAEGIETAIAAHKLYDIPVWATINANGMREFIPPPNVKYVWVFADKDRSYTGQAAAYHLAMKLTKSGYKVRVIIPKGWDTDINDYMGETGS